MRDISGDLQDRANVMSQQISAVQGQFDKHIEQLKREHEARLEDRSPHSTPCTWSSGSRVSALVVHRP